MEFSRGSGWLVASALLIIYVFHILVYLHHRQLRTYLIFCIFLTVIKKEKKFKTLLANTFLASSLLSQNMVLSCNMSNVR